MITLFYSSIVLHRKERGVTMKNEHDLLDTLQSLICFIPMFAFILWKICGHLFKHIKLPEQQTRQQNSGQHKDCRKLSFRIKRKEIPTWTMRILVACS